MSRWRRVVRRELDRYRRETGTDIVERQEFLRHALPVLETEFPDAGTPGQTFSRVMQELRDRDEVEFLDPGTYKLRSLGDDTGDVEVGAERDWNYEAATYETTVGARSIPRGFRNAVLRRHGTRCPVSGIDISELLDVAHVLPWSEYEDLRTEPRNVLPLDKTHHAAFDTGLYTFDEEFRLHLNPDFETDSPVLEQTLVEREGSVMPLDDDLVDPAYISQRNSGLDWW